MEQNEFRAAMGDGSSVRMAAEVPRRGQVGSAVGRAFREVVEEAVVLRLEVERERETVMRLDHENHRLREECDKFQAELRVVNDVLDQLRRHLRGQAESVRWVAVRLPVRDSKQKPGTYSRRHMLENVARSLDARADAARP